MKDELLILGYGFLCFFGGYWLHATSGVVEEQSQPPTNYHATCADDIFNGEVIKKGKKYYLDSGQEIWIPLKECVLVEL